MKQWEKKIIASSWCFVWLKKDLHNVRILGEPGNADEESAKSHNRISNEESYDYKQFFNVDETALLWKRRKPTKTFTAEKENPVLSYESSKDRIQVDQYGAEQLKDKKIRKVK